VTVNSFKLSSEQPLGCWLRGNAIAWRAQPEQQNRSRAPTPSERMSLSLE